MKPAPKGYTNNLAAQVYVQAKAEITRLESRERAIRTIINTFTGRGNDDKYAQIAALFDGSEQPAPNMVKCTMCDGTGRVNKGYHDVREFYDDKPAPMSPGESHGVRTKAQGDLPSGSAPRTTGGNGKAGCSSSVFIIRVWDVKRFNPPLPRGNKNNLDIIIAAFGSFDVARDFVGNYVEMKHRESPRKGEYKRVVDGSGTATWVRGTRGIQIVEMTVG